MNEIIPISSDRIPRPLANYSPAMRVGDLIFLAGQFASDFVTGVPEQVRIPAAYPYYGSAMERQTRYVLENIKALLEDAGSDLEHVVKTQVFIVDCGLFADFDRVWKEFFPTPPPRTTVEITREGLLVPGTLVEIDVIAVPRDGSHQPQVVSSPRSPAPLANYSPAVRYGDWLFLAGQLPTDFSPDELPAQYRVDPAFPFYGSAIERQTDYTLGNLRTLLEDAGSDLDHVVKAQVFLKNLADYHGFTEVWNSYFPDSAPPRTTVQVGELLIGHSLIEIDFIAVRKQGSIIPKRISTPASPRPHDAYVQAVEAGGIVFLAGQLATDFESGIPAEAAVDPRFPYFGSDIERQTSYLLANCDAVLAEAGTSIERTIKTQVFLTSLWNFAGMDKIWRRTFPTLPTRTTVEIPGLLVPGALVEVDIIAAV